MFVYRGKIISLILVITLVMSVFGCRKVEKRPDIDEDQGAKSQEKQGENQESEKDLSALIPEQIREDGGKEPSIKVYIVEEKKIKEMKFEEYVMGVLAGEMENDWPEEALMAQAVLARTFVLKFITEKGGSKHEGAHVSTDIEEAQAWNAEKINDRIKQAVEKTRGQVAIHKGKLINAWFHSHAGGKTATAKEGLGFEEDEPPYIKAVESPDSKEAPKEHANWTAVFTKDEVIAALKETGQTVSEFDKIEIIEKGPSNRALKLKISDTTVHAPSFRIAIGSKKMKSAKIENISVDNNKVTINGMGYGHGVGLSQWGAYHLANNGEKSMQILEHYFKDIEIVNLWD
ncbi:MAG: stage II sporulation protein SpoIID [Alkaliphilus sp.]|nr:SpoIID/LytB domain-containing protein [Alkaliphilus transvaalensis]MBN4074474.1 SpoIID/LytB domain-containing protein [bacterium AH-315-E09]PHS32947.1 MAG: stage II sporulation protein SpoIID [Alkaliphilus sp.]